MPTQTTAVEPRASISANAAGSETACASSSLQVRANSSGSALAFIIALSVPPEASPPLPRTSSTRRASFNLDQSSFASTPCRVSWSTLRCRAALLSFTVCSSACAAARAAASWCSRSPLAALLTRSPSSSLITAPTLASTLPSTAMSPSAVTLFSCRHGEVGR